MSLLNRDDIGLFIALGFPACCLPSEDVSPCLNRLFVDPALHVITVALHHQNARLTKLFDMMGYRGWRYIQFASQFPDAPPGRVDGSSPGAGGAEFEEAQEYREPVWAGQRFEHLGVSGYVFCFIILHISTPRILIAAFKSFRPPM